MPSLIFMAFAVLLLGAVVRLARAEAPPGTCHRAPDGPLDVYTAHIVLQARKECDPFHCDLKRAAMCTLIEARKLQTPLEVTR